MRILRVSLRDFRGVTTADVRFRADGVTIVHGPNEVGKSTLADAIDMLLSDPDSSAKARVKAAQPAGRDVGPWAQMEFETGPYRVVYSKRWVKGAATEVRVSGPRDEQHAGRAAHDRVVEILGETLDAALFTALRQQQGLPLDQADLGASASLARALDLAAGSGSVSDDDALVDRIEAERLRWSTAGGSPNKALLDLCAAADAADALARHEEERLEALEQRVDAHRRLCAELAASEGAEPGMRERLVEMQGALAQVDAREAAVRDLERAAEVAGADAAAAAGDLQARDAIARAVADATRRVEAVRADAQGLADRLRLAEGAVQQSADDLAAVAQRVRDADVALADASAAADQARDDFDLELLVERRGQVDDAEGRIAAAEAFLADCLLTTDLMQAIEDAATAHAVAQGRLHASGVRMAVSAGSRIRVVGPDGGIDLAAGESGHVSLAPGDGLEIPGIVAVRLEATDMQARDAADAAGVALEQVLGRAGVGEGGIAAARALDRERRDAERALATARDDRLRALRDLTTDEMDQKIARARTRAEAHGGAMPPASRDDAQARRERCEAERQAARRLEAVAMATRDDREAAARSVGALAAECRGRLSAEEQRLLDESAALGRARAERADDVLAARAAAAAAAADRARERHAAEAESLAQHDPESLRLRASNAHDALDRLLAERVDIALQAATMAGEIGQAGNDGLSDRAARAREDAWHARDARDRAQREARAADLLHEVMTLHLDAARRSYVAPFRDEVERLSRLVFGPGTTVEVDHASLQVVSRTRDGVTVPYEALSGGAREQLAVIGRLAAASLVAADGGAPVIIDDALGYSDPGRLEGLGAALASAGTGAQVIVLTCMPDRYAGIGSASVVRMQAGAEADTDEAGALGAEVA